MMRIKTREKVTALLMAALVSLGAATESFAFTPWSNINGKWISADGKTVIEDAVEKGITVSKYQNLKGEIDWKQVADDEISFAMVRLGYYEDKDPYFDQNRGQQTKPESRTGSALQQCHNRTGSEKRSSVCAGYRQRLQGFLSYQL